MEISWEQAKETTTVQAVQGSEWVGEFFWAAWIKF